MHIICMDINAYDEKLKQIEKDLSSPHDIPKDKLKELFDDGESLLQLIQRQKKEIKSEYKKAKRDSSELLGRLKDSKRYSKCIALVSNAKVDSLENEDSPFAKGLCFSKFFLVFVFGAIVGVLVEVAWAFIRFGQYQSRQGFIYGPFNPVYGFGAVFLTLFLYRYRNRAIICSFLGAMIIGSVLEYLLSFFQEKIFGSVSWDYSNVPLNINGRICLPYAVIWGVLGVLWIKVIYPVFSYWIMKIPKRAGKTLTIILFVFMVLNAAVTLSAVNRWSERIAGVEAKTQFDSFIDSSYPDEKMRYIYPNMVFGSKEQTGEE